MSLERKGAIAMITFFVCLLMALSEDASILVHIIGWIGYIASFIFALKVFREYERVNSSNTY